MSGTPPKTGWSRLVPELLVQDFPTSLAFWRDCLGFRIAYDRPEQRFAYLERPEGSQVMLCQRTGEWETGEMVPPFGRGLMLQIYVDDLEPVMAALTASHWPIYSPLREVWRRTGDREGGQCEVFVQDPDGYLLMIAEDLGERSGPIASSGAGP